MIKNLGGNRLGSGAKMNQHLHGWERSTHDLTTDIATTMSVGTLVPIHHSIILAGDTRELDIDAELLTHPTEGPLFGSFKLQVDVFKADFRLYIAKLHLNLLEKGLDMAAIKLPLIDMEANNIDWTKDPNNQQINPSSIFKYLHISGLGHNTTSEVPRRHFNAIAWLMYWDIYKNYYANKQEKYGAVIHTGAGFTETVTKVELRLVAEGATIDITSTTVPYQMRITGELIITYTDPEPKPEDIKLETDNGWITMGEMFQAFEYYESAGTKRLKGIYPKQPYTIKKWDYIQGTDSIATTPRVQKFLLSNLDDIKMDILSKVKDTTAYILNGASPEPFSYALQETNGYYSKMYSQEGLAIKTYQSDLFNNWLNTEFIDGVNGINARTAIQVDVEGKFTIDNFLLKEKLYDHLNRIAIAGGTVDDMMEVTYDVSNRTRPEIPTFEGGLSKELIFQQVISNSATGEQPLGTIAGRGTTAGHKGGKVRITNDDTQHAMYMVIASLTPRLRYSQGNSWTVNLKTYDDLHKPAFDQIGFQDLITDQMASWDTYKASGITQPIFKSAGKQPAWIHYQTEIDRVFGNFAIQNSEGWMVLDRNYDWDETTKTIKDLTTYIDPEKYNGVFAYKALDAQNIWAQFRIRDKATRKMSANQIPRM